MQESTQIAFIGAGNMANALIGGMVELGFSSDNIVATDPFQPSLDALQQQYGIATTSSNSEAAMTADVLILAVKPQVLKQAIVELAPALKSNSPLVISIVAGIQLSSIEAWLGQALAVVRCMPNTPALLQLGASALYGNQHVSAAQQALAESILGAVGITAWVDDEAKLDAVTAISGSGPAYFFAVMEAMQKIAITMGLEPEMAKQFVQQTALGAARMAQDSDEEVAELRKKVSSKGGTTLAALEQLEAGGLNELLATALQAARARAIEMADELGK